MGLDGGQAGSWPCGRLCAARLPLASGVLSALLGLERTREITSGKCSELLREKKPEGSKVGDYVSMGSFISTLV